MTRFHRRPASLLIATAACLAALLAGCGGNSSSAAVAPPAPVIGLATPTSIAVVTANNAP